MSNISNKGLYQRAKVYKYKWGFKCYEEYV